MSAFDRRYCTRTSTFQPDLPDSSRARGRRPRVPTPLTELPSASLPPYMSCELTFRLSENRHPPCLSLSPYADRFYHLAVTFRNPSKCNRGLPTAIFFRSTVRS